MPRRLSLPLDKIPARPPGHFWLIAVVAGVVGFIGSLVTIAAAIGWVYAILVVALVAVALPNWLEWVRRRGLQRELLSAKSEIASLSHQPRNGMVADYQFVLSRIATSSSRPLIESCKVQYRIGENASGDRTTLFGETAAGDTAQPIRWSIVRAWAHGAGSAQFSSFVDLVDLEAYELWPDGAEPTRMLLLDLGEHRQHLLGLLWFSSEVSDVPRRWKWSFTWPGMWTPLRERNSDWSEYDTRPIGNAPMRTRELTVSFAFPAQAKGSRVESAANMPLCVPEPDLDPVTGGRVFTCRLVEPEPALFNWTLRVEGWNWHTPPATGTTTQTNLAR